MTSRYRGGTTMTAILAAELVLLLGACTGNDITRERQPAPTRTAAATATSLHVRLGAPGCQPPSPVKDWPGAGPFLEVRGTPTRGQLWGLMFVEDMPIRVGDEVKIVWRMTGQGDFRMTVTAPDGTRQPPIFGPEPHPKSNYRRPGEEWGVGYHFTKPGCWTLHAARGDSTADVWLTVV